MKQVSKKEINTLLTEVRDIEASLNWKVWTIGAYVKDGEIETFAGYHGQGVEINVYNGDYDKIIEFKDIYNEWKDRLLTKKEAVDSIKHKIDNYLID